MAVASPHAGAVKQIVDAHATLDEFTHALGLATQVNSRRALPTPSTPYAL
jgi:hypothetical protein